MGAHTLRLLRLRSYLIQSKVWYQCWTYMKLSYVRAHLLYSASCYLSRFLIQTCIFRKTLFWKGIFHIKFHLCFPFESRGNSLHFAGLGIAIGAMSASSALKTCRSIFNNLAGSEFLKNHRKFSFSFRKNGMWNFPSTFLERAQHFLHNAGLDSINDSLSSENEQKT